MNILSRIILTLLLATVLSLPAQEEEPIKTGTEVPDSRERTILRSLAISMDNIEQEILNLKATREDSTSNTEQLELSEKIIDKERSLVRLNSEFISLATKVETASAGETEEEALTLQQEIHVLLQPVIGEMKDATLAPRRIEATHRELDELRDRRKTIQKIITGLEKQLAEKTDPLIQKRLQEFIAIWEPQMADLDTEIEIKRLRLTELERSDETIINKVSNGARTFFQTRGKHLIFAFLGFIFTFFLIRYAYALFRRLNPIHRKKGQSLSGRILDLAVQVGGLLIAILVAVFILYLANDWVLLVVVLLFLGGIAWAGKQALPQFYDQAKLMLNFGPVREGERVIYEGVSWRVGKIGLYTDFTNPALKGGLIRLPIRYLADLHSRPHEGELWFACEENDWVILSDDTFAKVIEQTPEYVQILRLGGSRKTIPTPSFLELNPENLSKNFRIASIFGIDYRHQAVSTTEVPTIFQKALTEGLASLVPADSLKNLTVQFGSAGASSLDYEIAADFSGKLAPKYQILRRAIQRICVDVCNEHDWGNSLHSNHHSPSGFRIISLPGPNDSLPFSKPFLDPEVDEQSANHDDQEGEENREGPWVVRARNSADVDAKKTREETKWKKDRGNNREHIHANILLFCKSAFEFFLSDGSALTNRIEVLQMADELV